MRVTDVNGLSFRQFAIYSLQLDMQAEIRLDALGKQQVIMSLSERLLPNVCEIAAKEPTA